MPGKTRACCNRIEDMLDSPVADYVYPNGIASEATDLALHNLGVERTYATIPGINELGE